MWVDVVVSRLQQGSNLCGVHSHPAERSVGSRSADCHIDITSTADHHQCLSLDGHLDAAANACTAATSSIRVLVCRLTALRTAGSLPCTHPGSRPGPMYKASHSIHPQVNHQRYPCTCLRPCSDLDFSPFSPSSRSSTPQLPLEAAADACTVTLVGRAKASSTSSLHKYRSLFFSRRRPHKCATRHRTPPSAPRPSLNGATGTGGRTILERCSLRTSRLSPSLTARLRGAT